MKLLRTFLIVEFIMEEVEDVALSPSNQHASVFCLNIKPNLIMASDKNYLNNAVPGRDGEDVYNSLTPRRASSYYT